MAQIISIVSIRGVEDIGKRISRKADVLRAGGIFISLRQIEDGEYGVLQCKVMGEGLSRQGEDFDDAVNLVKGYLANAVAETILEEWEQSLLKRTIEDEYYFLDKEEKEAVLQKALEVLTMEGEEGEGTAFYHQSRKSQLVERLMEHFSEADSINVEGFIRFRLQDYLQELITAAENAVDEFMMEKEYADFIRLLKYFVDVQKPRTEEIHVLLSHPGGFQLYDGSWHPINGDSFDGFLQDLIDENINYDDILISALITIAPRKVILHGEASRIGEAVATIVKVFEDRVGWCPGCEGCRTLLRHKEN